MERSLEAFVRLSPGDDSGSPLPGGSSHLHPDPGRSGAFTVVSSGFVRKSRPAVLHWLHASVDCSRRPVIMTRREGGWRSPCIRPGGPPRRFLETTSEERCGCREPASAGLLFARRLAVQTFLSPRPPRLMAGTSRTAGASSAPPPGPRADPRGEVQSVAKRHWSRGRNVWSPSRGHSGGALRKGQLDRLPCGDPWDPILPVPLPRACRGQLRPAGGPVRPVTFRFAHGGGFQRG